MSDPRDPYEVLGVPRTASTKQIRAAFIERARNSHPDIVGRRGLDTMRALNEAWDTLKDEERRAAWHAANGGAAANATQGGDGSTARSERKDSRRPFWFGAHGPAPGRPSGPVLDFGIFEGWSIGEVARVDRGYLMWLRDRPEGAAIRTEISRLVDPTAEEPSDLRQNRRR
ncbi:MAG TPA: DnaJ domain-containing protein [Candidatus Limnocylindria bacterium]|nr:DnaJ domain-containing protein [Candidatus Limnocylindria bacterium]